MMTTSRHSPGRLAHRLAPSVILSLAVSACGGAAKDSGAHPDIPDDVANPCRAGDVSACLETARRQCRAGDPVYRLRYDTLPPVTVGPHRLVRLDDLGGTFYGVDSTHWLGCFARCPENGPARICFPIDVPLHMSWTAGQSCQRQTQAAAPWQGHPSQTLALDCGGDRSTLRFVPALSAVQRELVSAGAIDGDDPLARTGGLVVEMSAGGVTQSTLAELSPAPEGCDAFAPPAGYRRIDDLGAYQELNQIAVPHADQLAEEVGKIQAQIAGQAIAQAKVALMPQFRATYGEKCRAAGHDPTVDSELEKCVAAIPETEEPFRAAVGRATAKLLAARRSEIDALTEKLLVAPLCRQFAASAPPDAGGGGGQSDDGDTGTGQGGGA